MANTKVEAIQAQIDKLVAEKKALEESEAALENGVERAWADLLHGRECRYAHEDQCGWFYESWDCPGYARREYLDKARTVLAEAKSEGITPKMLLKVMRIT